ARRSRKGGEGTRRRTARVPAGADARRARGPCQPERGGGARRQGELVARTEAAAGVDRADAAGGRAERSWQAVRLAEREGLGIIRQLDVLAQAPAQRSQHGPA